MSVHHFRVHDRRYPLNKSIRDIFGNPYRVGIIRSNGTVPCLVQPISQPTLGVRLIPLTNTVVQIAASIYEEQQWDEMPVLGDALEDMGCDDSEILGHLRSRTQPHHCGCWVLDRILGKL